MNTMKSVLIFVASSSILFFSTPLLAQVGIGTNNPNASAMLEISNNSKGLLIPRMTEVQRTAINFPSKGLLVYQTDNAEGFYYNSGTPGLPDWVSIISSSSVGNTWSLSGNDMYNLNIGNVGIGTVSPVQKFAVNGNINIPVDSSYMIANIKILSTKGTQNTFVGEYSGRLNTGTQNAGFGQASLYNNTTGSGNAAFGRSSLSNNIDGNDNAAFGKLALQLNTSGSNNSAFGTEALKANTTGSSNVALGAYALLGNNASNNTAIGYSALAYNSTGTGNTAGGYQSLFTSTGNDNTAFGNIALSLNSNTSKNTAIGSRALGYQTITGGGENTAIGYLALANNTTGQDNTAIGVQSLASFGGFETGNRNTAIGHSSLRMNTSGEYNVAIGYEAMSDNIITGNTSGSYNVAVGNSALDGNTTGNNNTAIGNEADVSSNDWSNATAIGNSAVVDASNKVRIGNSSVSSIGGQVSWTAFSDERIKRNILEDVKGLSFIMKLKPVTYNYSIEDANRLLNRTDTVKWNGKYDIEKIRFSGFTAQDVEKAALQSGYNFSGVDKPQNVSSIWGLRYAEFVIPLVKAIQEQQQMIEKYQYENKQLKEQVKEIKKEIEVIKRVLLNK